MCANEVNRISQPDFALQCADLDSAQEFFIQELAFRLEMIYPADEPRAVILGGYGIRLQLEQSGRSAPGRPFFQPSTVIQRVDGHAWGEGRAGMQYRDLIPDRLGGKYIASHIRIPLGGPVADYVHHHHIQFQLIYCYKGWVRVVYEDQGPALVMHAGDCVLQPPHIRHRVLECSDGMEVVEIACPAEHETLVEYQFGLPTQHVDSDRYFGTQKFVFHKAEHAEWQAASIDGFACRDTGISAATAGIASAAVLRPVKGNTTAEFAHDAELFFNFVLSGTVTLHTHTEQEHALQAGDSFVIPPGDTFSLSEISQDLEILQVTSPG